MHAFFYLALTLSSASVVLADCCYKTDGDSCGDGTTGTPYCGIGPCNAFGCECEGGCRGAAATIKLLNDDGTAMSDTQQFTAADADGTGYVTLPQFLEYVGTDSGQDFTEAFHTFDKDGNGIITEDEVRL